MSVEPETRTGGGPATNGHEPVLVVEDIHTFYGSIEALKGISLVVNQGEIVTLIGANGAGKSTTLRSISGIVPPRAGRIRTPRSSPRSASPLRPPPPSRATWTSSQAGTPGST